MCLVNIEPQDEKPSIPGLRPLLSKSASVIFGWFLAGITNTSYWDMYSAISKGRECEVGLK